MSGVGKEEQLEIPQSSGREGGREGGGPCEGVNATLPRREEPRPRRLLWWLPWSLALLWLLSRQAPVAFSIHLEIGVSPEAGDAGRSPPRCLLAGRCFARHSLSFHNSGKRNIALSKEVPSVEGRLCLGRGGEGNRRWIFFSTSVLLWLC